MIPVKSIMGAVAIAAAPAFASAAVLDDFSTLQRVEDAPSATYPSSSTISTPYGTRTMDIDATPDPSPGATSVTTLSSGARTPGNPRDLSFSNDSNFRSVANVMWNFTSPLDVSGSDAFSLGFKETDNPFYLTLTATGGGATASQETYLTAADAGTLDFDFSGFGGVDFSSLSSFKLTFDSTRTVQGVDADFDNLSIKGAQPAPIPLPASALLLAAGLGGLAAVRRRKT